MNHGSTLLVKCTMDEIDGCRKIIGPDGCFIKGFHKGQLLTAIGVDPNNQMYHIAYVVVEAKTRATWF